MAYCAYIIMRLKKFLLCQRRKNRELPGQKLEHANIKHLYANNPRYLVVRVLLHYYTVVSYYVRVVSREI